MKERLPYQGYEIEVSDAYQFKALNIDDAEWHPTIAAAKVDIDKELTRLQLLDKDKRAIEMLDHTGDEVVITGIHRGTSDLTWNGGKKANRQSYEMKFYPRVPWIRERIETVTRLSRELNEARESLRPYAIKKDVGRGRLALDEYEQRMNEVEANIQKVARAAHDAAPGKA